MRRLMTIAIAAGLGLAAALALGLVWYLSTDPLIVDAGVRLARVRTYRSDPAAYAHWEIRAGEQCPGAPFIVPTTGLIGFGYGDSWRTGQVHQGFDIFGPTRLGETPVVAAYEGYLTRLLDWQSTVIIRVPDDPLQPGRQIWTYYTHLADSQGRAYISPEFPPGTTEQYVRAGTPLGYQGNYSGDPNSPVGMHLHFSIVKDDGQGRFLNELRLENTLDPSPYLGLDANAQADWSEPVTCRKDEG
jgi:murein DD-endopeptidase MepM/ murein hydrolase activator NlpD